MEPLPVIISGLAMGCIYALVALGYVFIWNSMAIINFAQGEFLMFAAFVYVATFSMWLALGFVPSILLTAAAMGLLGAVFSRTVYSRLRGQSQLVAIIATVGMGILLKEGARLVNGPEPFFNAAINSVNRLINVQKVPLMLRSHYTVAQMASKKPYCEARVSAAAGGTDPDKLRQAFLAFRYTGLMADFKFEPNGVGNHQVHMVEDRKGQAKSMSTVKF